MATETVKKITVDVMEELRQQMIHGPATQYRTLATQELAAIIAIQGARFNTIGERQYDAMVRRREELQSQLFGSP